MLNVRCLLLFMLLALPVGVIAQETTNTILIGLNKQRQPVSKELYGLFFEDINFGGDGGLYAELLQNRSFEDNLKPNRCDIKDHNLVSPTGWKCSWYKDSIVNWKTLPVSNSRLSIAIDNQSIADGEAFTSLRLDASKAKGGKAGIYNTGFGGIAVVKGEKFNVTIIAKRKNMKAPVNVSIETADGKILGTANIGKLTSDWKQYNAVIEASANATDVRFVVSTEGSGTFWLDYVSLFPQKTFMNRSNGLRNDLAMMLKDLSPKFLRFPGGCVVEGFSKETMLNWKSTIGPLWERPGQFSLWGYRNTNGLGYLEFLQYCEDMDIEPMFVFNCGMTCQGRSPEFSSDEDIKLLVQDALDAIEYANGDASTIWGALRIKHGHKEPFNLRYLEIGNENWGPEYEKRYKVFYDAIKSKHPNMLCIADAWVTSAPLEMVDEHFYPDPYFFMAHHNHYDNFDSTKAKIYAGEYAAIQKCGTGNLLAAIGEAAFLVGLERNPQVVKMSSYAPLFKNVFHPNPWNPDAINFDQNRAYGTPSYYVQKMFGANRGDELLSTNVTTSTRPYTSPGKIAFNGTDALVEFKDIIVTGKDGELWKTNQQKGLEQFSVQSGKWECSNGVLKQLDKGDEFKQVAHIGDFNWHDYTLQFKVRKVSGTDGFVIRFRDNGLQYGDRDFCQIAFGAQGGKMVVAEHVVGWTREFIGAAQPFNLVESEWFDVKISCINEKITCSINNREIVSASMPSIPAIVSVATIDKQTNVLILKIVNTTTVEQTTTIQLDGVTKVKPQGKIVTISSNDVDIENSLDKPNRIVPVETVVDGLGHQSVLKIAPNSVNVLRVELDN